MRESVGATWIFSICLTFIILFTAYLAISVNYAKAFRIKNYIVSKIEENEGIVEGDELSTNILNYLINQGYSAKGTCSDTYKSTNNGESDADWTIAAKIGQTDPSNKYYACIYKRAANAKNNPIKGDKAYYKVVAFFKFDLPIVNTLTTFQISGESKLVLKNNGGE